MSHIFLDWGPIYTIIIIKNYEFNIPSSNLPSLFCGYEVIMHGVTDGMR